MDDIKERIKKMILMEFLPGEGTKELDDTTPLITGGILDSIATVKMIVMLENEFRVDFQPDEMTVDHLDTIAGLANIIQTKIKEE